MRPGLARRVAPGALGRGLPLWMPARGLFNPFASPSRAQEARFSVPETFGAPLRILAHLGQASPDLRKLNPEGKFAFGRTHTVPGSLFGARGWCPSSRPGLVLTMKLAASVGQGVGLPVRRRCQARLRRSRVLRFLRLLDQRLDRADQLIGGGSFVDDLPYPLLPCFKLGFR
jgi:hypothetical protein